MGWFDQQIKQRIKSDDEAFSQAFDKMAGVVMGKRFSRAMEDDRQKTRSAIEIILKFYHVKIKDVPDNISDIDDQLEYLMRPSGIMRRTVNLTGEWYKEVIGAMLGTLKKDGSPVALVPYGYGYYLVDAETKKRRKINKQVAKEIDVEAICFYKSFPLKELGIKDLMIHILQIMSVSDFVMVAVATLAVTLIGMLTPKINNIIYSYVIVSDNLQLLFAIFTFLISVSISKTLIGVTSSLITSRFSTKMDISIQASSIMRILSLPAKFFKDYSSGELSERIGHINSLCSKLVNSFLTTGLTSIFSLVYISQMIQYGPSLVVPGLVVILVTVTTSTVITLLQLKISKERMEKSAKETGIVYALFTGVQKLRLAGAEKRAFARWADAYLPVIKLAYDPPAIIKYSGLISTWISLVGTIVIYFFTIQTHVSLADYYSFNSAYGMVMGAFSALIGLATTFAEIQPTMEMVKPLLRTIPEISENKRMVTRLSGSVEINNVSFKYTDISPLVLDDFSLKISSGQYVAIVGETGCGKSTLVRIMLGFETPQKGAIYYDGQDISNLDLKSLRQKIGVVMQNGKLFQGDVFSNITITAPHLGMKEAWEAAELASIAEDIRDMPMEMHTIISEGSGGISGGQRQRIMIARAIAPKPKIVILDEATSALDNISQKAVSESLEALKCTRIVIAHRLSTIKHCDRIVVIKDGKVGEDGTYEELMNKKGLFAELVSRQHLDSKSEKEEIIHK